jgi:hypothetical protein
MPPRSSLFSTTLALLGALGGGWLETEGAGPSGAARVDDHGRRLEAAWHEAILAVEQQDRETLTNGYRARFRSLAGEGDGPARLWLLEHGAVRDPQDRLGLARDLVRDHAHEAELLAPRFLALLEADPGLSHDGVHELARGLADTSRDPELAAGALLALAYRLAPLACEDPDLQAGARALCDETSARWPESRAAGRAAALAWRLTHLAVGRSAPGFVARDARGNELRSEHLRGRVVVVSLWRFSDTAWQTHMGTERRMRDRLWDERFTWLGINLDPDADAFVRRCDDRDIDWKQHAWEGGPSRPVCEAWRVGDRPLLVLLDDDGVVRGIDLTPERLERRTASLLTDLRAKIVARETLLEDHTQGGR